MKTNPNKDFNQKQAIKQQRNTNFNNDEFASFLPLLKAKERNSKFVQRIRDKYKVYDSNNKLPTDLNLVNFNPNSTNPFDYFSKFFFYESKRKENQDNINSLLSVKKIANFEKNLNLTKNDSNHRLFLTDESELNKSRNFNENVDVKKAEMMKKIFIEDDVSKYNSIKLFALDQEMIDDYSKNFKKCFDFSYFEKRKQNQNFVMSKQLKKGLTYTLKNKDSARESNESLQVTGENSRIHENKSFERSLMKNSNSPVMRNLLRINKKSCEKKNEKSIKVKIALSNIRKMLSKEKNCSPLKNQVIIKRGYFNIKTSPISVNNYRYNYK